MATQILHQHTMHPAWAAAAHLLADDDRWQLRAAGKAGGYLDAEIALAMAVGGYGDDLIITVRDADGLPRGYAFPDRWIPDCDNMGGEVTQ